MAEQQPTHAPGMYSHLVYRPYAKWLAETDRFEEALAALKRAGETREACTMLNMLAKNAVHERRYLDAARYLWRLYEEGSLLSNARATDANGARVRGESVRGERAHFAMWLGVAADESNTLYTFERHRRLSELYYAYECIYQSVEVSFHKLSQSELP